MQEVSSAHNSIDECTIPERTNECLVEANASINQSKILTKPHTGRGEATSQHHHRGGKPCITK